jgi:hypothetical protein
MSGPNEELPNVGIVIWPVGNGDSITVLVGDAVLQVDICHLEVADGEDDDRIHVIDALLELLKERPLGTDGRPFLSCFALTHPDTDHVKGFQELLDTVNIGELWLTPRIFRDHGDDTLNEDAKDFHKEAMRRVKATIKAGGLPASGDRVRVIGWDALLDEDDFKGFPRDLLTIPGTEITGFDGQNLSEVFRAFVHAPFAADSEGERNDTSLGMQVTLTGSGRTIRVMLLGDLCAPTVHRIFCDATPDAENLAWDIFVPPHHCSKGALFVAGDSGEPELDEELVECLNEHGADGAYVVASCDEFSDSDETGDQPPHLMAREAYEEIVAEEHFLATSEQHSDDGLVPIVFSADDAGELEPSGGGGLLLALAIAAAAVAVGSGVKAIRNAVARSRGSDRPPSRPVGFGSHESG